MQFSTEVWLEPGGSARIEATAATRPVRSASNEPNNDSHNADLVVKLSSNLGKLTTGQPASCFLGASCFADRNDLNRCATATGPIVGRPSFSSEPGLIWICRK